jgi:hypothetical protein
MKNEDYVKIFEEAACHQVYKMADGVAAVVKAVEDQYQGKRTDNNQYIGCEENGIDFSLHEEGTFKEELKVLLEKHKAAIVTRGGSQTWPNEVGFVIDNNYLDIVWTGRLRVTGNDLESGELSD